MSELSADQLPLSYVIKSRDFYEARGFSRPYQWAQHADSPFASLPKPLSECTVGVVTTTMIFHDQGDELLVDAPKATAFAHNCEPRPDMFTNHLSWHKRATSTDDSETFLPLDALNAAASEGRIGGVSARFYGAPTNYSQRETRDDAKRVADWCAEDEVDVVLLIPL